MPNSQPEALFPIIQAKIRPDNIIYSESSRAYGVLDVSAFHQGRINKSKAFVHDRNHINGIENFRNLAKRHLRRFNCAPSQNFNP